uniref:MADF domain-containing protein n=1 Tax=Heliothis virescens TaxID=7102 RepID=A0A2A4K500_HELVI
MSSKKIIDEQVFLTKVLRKYRKSACLWDLMHKDYHNKSVKEAAWDKIVKLYQKTYPNVNKSDVKSKLCHMRTNYTRQRKKVENNTGKITLWYYRHLCFLSGDVIIEDDEDSDSDEEEQAKPSVSKKRKASTTEQESSGGPHPVMEDASAEAFGRSVGAQLQHLSKMQRCIAEKLISDVIYHGKLQQLTTGAQIKVEGSATTDDIVIPPAEPSWYEMDGTTEPTSSCVTMADNPQNVDETENAVTGIKFEMDENNFYVSEHVGQHSD